VTFGLISFHLVDAGIVPVAGAPLLYAAAMAAGAVAALLTGEAYDRVGPRTLLALPVLVAAVPPLAFAGGLAAVTAGVLLWGAAVGLQDSTVKALVADLVRPDRRATAFGLFAAVQGVGALVGGIATGALYEHSTRSLAIAVIATQILAAALLITLSRRSVASR
jgi:MFS family permease